VYPCATSLHAYQPTHFTTNCSQGRTRTEYRSWRIRQPYNVSHPNGYGPWCFSDLGTVPHYVHLTILPHFTSRVDWLPYRKWGFLLFQDFVVWARFELAAHGFSVHCSTYWAITPNVRLRTPLCCKVCSWIDLLTSLTLLFLSQGNNTLLWLKDSNLRRGATQFGSWDRRYTCITIISLIMLEYPSRSNLNCLIVVLRGLGRGWWIPVPSWIVDIRWAGKTIIKVVGRRIELLLPGWKPEVLTDRRTDHI
jgi:hypothetical protein